MSPLQQLLKNEHTYRNRLSLYIYDLKKNLSYQSCKRTVLSSRYIVFDKKSIPIVAWNYMTKNFVSNIEKENANAQMKSNKKKIRLNLKLSLWMLIKMTSIIRFWKFNKPLKNQHSYNNQDLEKNVSTNFKLFYPIKSFTYSNHGSLIPECSNWYKAGWMKI